MKIENHVNLEFPSRSANEGFARAAAAWNLSLIHIYLVCAWLLVAVLDMGIQGTALATASAQLLSTLLCFLYIRKRRAFLTIHRGDMRMDRQLVRLTSSYAAVAALQQSSLYLGCLLYTSRRGNLLRGQPGVLGQFRQGWLPAQSGGKLTPGIPD